MTGEGFIFDAKASSPSNSVLVTASEMDPLMGTGNARPTQVGGEGAVSWERVDGETSRFGFTPKLPAGRSTARVVAIWHPETAAAGDVRVEVRRTTRSIGESAIAADTASAAVLLGDGTVNLHEGQALLSFDRSKAVDTFAIDRLGTHASDTLTATARLVGLRFERVT